LIASDSEAIFYGILDLLAKPGFGALLLWGHRNIQLERLGLHIHDPEQAPGAGMEKTNALHNGSHNNGAHTLDGNRVEAADGPTV
jgi:bacteriorhodopsin